MTANLDTGSARDADYNKVAAELRSVIPPGQTAYGSIASWLALHDHPFISYQRTTPTMAASQFYTRYFIAGDRVMASGRRNEDVFYQDLRQGMAEVIAHSNLVGHFPDPYYGDLKAYELRTP
jgi:hypothetical protein